MVWKGERPPSGIMVAFFLLTHLVYRGLFVGQDAESPKSSTSTSLVNDCAMNCLVGFDPAHSTPHCILC